MLTLLLLSESVGSSLRGARVLGMGIGKLFSFVKIAVWSASQFDRVESLKSLSTRMLRSCDELKRIRCFIAAKF